LSYLLIVEVVVSPLVQLMLNFKLERMLKKLNFALMVGKLMELLSNVSLF